MKTKILKRTIGISLILMLMIIGNSCSDLFQNPLKDKNTGNDVTALLIDLNFFEVKFKIHIIDAETEEYVEGAELNVFITGNSASNVVNFSGEKKNTFTTSSGYLELTYDPNVEISANNPIKFEVQATSDEYFSFPTEVNVSEKGNEDIYVYVFKATNEKSASVVADPFTMEYAPSSGLTKLSLSESSLRLISSNYPVYNIWGVYRNTSAGDLTAKNFNGDPNLYNEWGFHYYYMMNPSEKSNGDALKSQNFSKANYIIPALLKRNGISKCDNGIRVNYSKSGGSGGTTAIKYQLTLSDNTFKKGLHSGSLPFAKTINNFYYPTANPSGVLELIGDMQFELSPNSFNIENACNSSVLNVTLTPITGLTHCKFTYVLTCENGNTIGAAITYNLQIREHGSEASWSWVETQGGFCELWLKKNTQYDVRFNWDGDWNEFSITTDYGNLESFIESQSGSNFSFVPASDNPDGLKVINQADTLLLIDANIQISGAFCNSFQ